MVDPAYLVAVGGGVGAVLRYLVGEALSQGTFPVGTLAVNVVGSLVLAAVTFGPAGGDLVLLVGTGACGAFTTFSSFSYGVVRLWERGRPVLSVVYALANLVGSLLAVVLVAAVLGG
jgi:CrcB protein